jgi:hypothetical protein
MHFCDTFKDHTILMTNFLIQESKLRAIHEFPKQNTDFQTSIQGTP